MLDHQFDGINFVINPLTEPEYENCVFNHCNFGSVDLSHINFIDCKFSNCELSLVKLKDTGFRNVQFDASKLLGVSFENCKKFGFSIGFKGCNLSHTSFQEIVIKKTKFKHCILQDADFAAADLSNAVFDHCDLGRAVFESCNLSGADFRTSLGYVIDPENNNLKQAYFSIIGLPGLLEKYNIRVED